jgi:hypothetical protein
MVLAVSQSSISGDNSWLASQKFEIWWLNPSADLCL